MKSDSIPNPAVRRISLYLRRLERLAAEGLETVSSRQLAQSLHLTDAQVRKDLTYFGQFGRPGVGYQILPLIKQLRRILGTDKVSNVILVGAGDLGRALLGYRGFRERGFNIVGAFDVAESKIGRKIGPVEVRHVDEISRTVREHGVRLAVLTVPADAAQEVAAGLQEAGICGILNFAPTTLEVPRTVAVSPVDLAASLEELSYRVQSISR